MESLFKRLKEVYARTYSLDPESDADFFDCVKDIYFSREVQSLKTEHFKVQIAFPDAYDRTRFAGLPGIELLHFTKQGSVANLIVKGDRQAVAQALQELCPSVLDILPLSLEEVFTYEMETMGYAFNLS